MLSEIREVDADAVTASIYHDIRQSSALPQVNLIYRHLATLPGALPAIWASVRPWVRSAAADMAVATLLAPGSTAGRAAPLRVPVADKTAIADLLSVYGRGNAINLFALSGIRHRLRNPALPGLSPPPSRCTALTVPLIPPLPRLAELPSAMAELVAELTRLHEAARHGVTPSLYLHLAQWPGILPSVRDYVVHYVQQRGLAIDHASITEAAAAYGIAAAPSELTHLTVETRDRALSAIDLFVSSVIPDLVAVGRVLASAVRNHAAA